MIELLPPKLEQHGNFLVVREDLLDGGTKRRVIPALFNSKDCYVYPSPAYGYGQLALAYACKDWGKQAIIFVAKRNQLHSLTEQARSVGARIFQVPYGYLTTVKKRASEHCLNDISCKLCPFGFDCPEIIEKIVGVSKKLSIFPKEVWCAGGSGVLTRALQIAWPEASHKVVQVGRKGNYGKAIVYEAEEKFEQNSKIKPPFPSCINYDAKVWQWMLKYASKNALFWNVGR